MNDAILALMQKFQRNEKSYKAQFGNSYCETRLRPATSEEIRQAEQAGFLSELVEFYRKCNSDECIEFKQRLWSVDRALEENREYVPGCFLFPHGYIVFASNCCGDAYCIDANTTTPEGHHPVVLFPHDAIADDTPLATIQSYKCQVADSFESFLVKFMDETLIDETSYG